MSASLYIESTGRGRPLIMLHGWGLHGGVFESVLPSLAESFSVYRVDLPGFGRSEYPGEPLTVAGMAKAVSEAVPENAVWMAWSMGALVALQAALAGASIEKLILVASTPRFVSGDDWPHAVEAGVLDNFRRELAKDYRATLQRFLALQCRGSERARDELRKLKETVFAHGDPSADALSDGLKILHETDLRAELPQVKQAVCFIQGERDTLIPVAAAKHSAQAVADARVITIEGAGHAPFISHPEIFVNEVERFIHE